jgi:hypothetical protein
MPTPLKTWIVEDNADNLELLKYRLEQCNIDENCEYSFIISGISTSFIEAVNNLGDNLFHIECLILDIELDQRKNIFELLNHKSISSRLFGLESSLKYILLLSAHHLEPKYEQKIRNFSEKCFGYQHLSKFYVARLVKPVRKEEIIINVRDLASAQEHFSNNSMSRPGYLEIKDTIIRISDITYIHTIQRSESNPTPGIEIFTTSGESFEIRSTNYTITSLLDLFHKLELNDFQKVRRDCLTNFAQNSNEIFAKYSPSKTYIVKHADQDICCQVSKSAGENIKHFIQNPNN